MPTQESAEISKSHQWGLEIPYSSSQRDKTESFAPLLFGGSQPIVRAYIGSKKWNAGNQKPISLDQPEGYARGG